MSIQYLPVIQADGTVALTPVSTGSSSASSSGVAPYWLEATDAALTVADKQVLYLAAMFRLDGEVKLDGMMVSD